MEKKRASRNLIFFFCAFIAILAFAAMLTIFADPYFHYHKPFAGIRYLLHDERYQNDGIVDHFDYNAVITGTSMTENFKTSEFDALFDARTVKVPFSGGSHREVCELLTSAFDHNNNIKYVVRSIDLFRAFEGKDSRDYSADLYPTYLYDDNPFNDVRYLFNKTVFFKETIGVLRRTKGNSPMVSFDEYAAWWPYYEFGPAAIMENYARNKVEYTGNSDITEEEYNNIRENFEVNVLSLAKGHPETVFYVFVSPYSIYFFDYINEMGELDRYQKAERYILSLLMGYDNIRVFSFFTKYDEICNPNNYRDVAHYHARINSEILNCMKEDKYRITEENINEYCDTVWDFYHNYDYDSLYDKDGITILAPDRLP